MNRFRSFRHNNRRAFRKRGGLRGFSLLELLIAMIVFLIVAGAAFSLFNQQVAFATHQQTLSGVNIGLRNAMSQLEMDLANAGQNLVAGAYGAPTGFSLGVTIQNNIPGTAAACTPNTSSWAYPTSSACFDALTIPSLTPCLQAGSTSPAILTIAETSQNYDSLGSSTTITADDANISGNLTVQQNDTVNTSKCFKSGDEILVVQFPANGSTSPLNCDNAKSYYCMSVVTLTANAVLSGGTIQLTHTLTGAKSDPIGIVYPSGGGTNYLYEIGQTCGSGGQTDCFSNGSYVVDLGTADTSISYSVQANPSNSADAQLMRCTGGTCSAVLDQVIGFKIGAALWSSASQGQTDIANYFFNSLNYCSDAISGADCSQQPPPANDPNNFSLIRAVRVSMIGRTTPSTDMAMRNFHNTFDGGPYLVQQASVVADLRNMSNTDSQN